MSKTVEVKISPYIPLSPDISALRPVNGYFSLSFQYAGDKEEKRSTQSGAYKNPTVTISGFVKEEGDLSAVFNTSDEFSAFVNSLQFDDTSMYDRWKVVKPDGHNVLKIVKKTPLPLKEGFVCSLHSLKFNPTNLKGDDSRVVLKVRTEEFRSGAVDEYNLYAAKIYISDILSFQPDKETVEIGQNVNLTWSSRGDYVDGANLRINNEEPKAVDISGSYTVSVNCPALFKLEVHNKNPCARFCASAYAVVGIKPPRIEKFNTDKEYVYNKKSITLSWKACSVYSCQLDGKEEDYAAEHSLTVKPDFTVSGSKKFIEYCLTAFGYHGQVPYSVFRKLEVNRTFWEEAGEITGVDLSKLTMNQTKGIYYEGEKSYLFDGTAIYSSDNELSYRKVSALSEDKGILLNSKYKNGFCNGIFYVAGLQSDSDMYIACYDIKNEIWTLEWASDSGEKFLNGCFAADADMNEIYYLFSVEQAIYIYQRRDGGWSLTGHLVFDNKITVFDCCIWRDRVNLAMLCADRKIRVYHIKDDFGKIVKNLVIPEIESEVSLVATENGMWILGEQSVYNVQDGRKEDVCYKGRLLTGCGSEPVMICRMQGKEKLYKLHTKEM